MAARSVPVAAGEVVPASDVSVYRGFSLRETSGTSRAVVRVRDGGPTGSILEPLALEPGESVGDHYGDGLQCVGSLYVQIVQGAVEGTLRYS